MRKVNPRGWNATSATARNMSNATKVATTNALGIYLEICQIDNKYVVKTWDGRTLGVFSDIKQAELIAKSFKTNLMPTSAITDIRYIPDPALLPTPKKRTKAVMKPVEPEEQDFIPIEEDNGIVVDHPEDIVIF
jgi:hypothetical protein